jgi:hypothetical protein
MFENSSVWRPPNCTSYLEENNKEKEDVIEEVKEEKKPKSETKPSSKPSRKGLLGDRFVMYFVREDLEAGVTSELVELINYITVYSLTYLI